ncbi:lysozyme inhibitor LprI family protein [Erwinia amylovora]|uniref:lysozyme inhibitor LprI family protein n=1 Tax=Erwinia amylovora TaxID=552 RepID=UPI00144462BF|nr:lysozyme inhibitor LprI family protein [Erwinia amylovora]
MDMNRLLSLSIYIITLQASFSAYAINDCSKETSDPAVFTCAEKNKDVAEKNLNHEYLAAKKRIEDLFSHEADVKKEYLTNFIESQRGWLKYRDGQCKLYAHVADKNSNPYIVFTNYCIAQLDEDRSKQLKEIPYD